HRAAGGTPRAGGEGRQPLRQGGRRRVRLRRAHPARKARGRSRGSAAGVRCRREAERDAAAAQETQRQGAPVAGQAAALGSAAQWRRLLTPSRNPEGVLARWGWFSRYFPAARGEPSAMSINFHAEAEALRPEIIARRRDFHRHPELAFEEVRTAEIVANTLRDLGLEVQTGVGRTGVVALLEGAHDGPTVLVRADMDALPIHEENETEYASTVAGK